MFKFILAISFCFMLSFSKAQNLVINPSFEDTIACSNLAGYDYPCIPWYEAVVSPDYLSSVYDSACGFTYVPQNFLGFQYPRTGFAYMGFATYVNPYPTPNRREYLGGKISSPLIANHDYCVSFYVNSANNCIFYADGMGIYFSVDSINPDTIQSVLPYMPQVSNPSGNILNDTLNWTLVSGTFRASGGERYMCIGSFIPDTLLSLDSNLSALYRAAYYFIDDVSVIDCTVGINDFEEEKEKLVVYPNPTKDEITISLNNSITNNLITVFVYDVLGNEILKHESKTSNTKLQISNISKGIYFVEVISGKEVYRRKLVKQ